VVLLTPVTAPPEFRVQHKYSVGCVDPRKVNVAMLVLLELKNWLASATTRAGGEAVALMSMNAAGGANLSFKKVFPRIRTFCPNITRNPGAAESDPDELSK
jgi:hypothetical protein